MTFLCISDLCAFGTCHAFITINCFADSDTIVVSMARNMTVCDVFVTLWNDLCLMWYLLYKYASVV